MHRNLVKYAPTSVLALLLWGASAFGATDSTALVYTFVCNGSVRLGGRCPEGGRPDTLIQGSDRNFYGTAQVSSEGTATFNGGSVFSLSPSGDFRLLHTFAPGSKNTYPGGSTPGDLIEGPDGKLYGTTLLGGQDGCDGICGYGVLYRVNTDGSGFAVLHEFCSQADCSDGARGSGLVVGNDGNLYGVAQPGGSTNDGVIFRVTPSTGAYDVVFNFRFRVTGELPTGLVAAPDGTLYGNTTADSGQLLFHFVEATGKLTTAPMQFPEFNSGTVSAFGPDGDLYGLYFVYAKVGVGLFEVSPNGENLQFFPFYNDLAGGGQPSRELLLASDGNFWLTDISGGSAGYGEVIALSPTDGSQLLSISPFSATAAVGAFPAALVQANDGTLWGSTGGYAKSSKGHFANGTIYTIDAGLPPR